MAAGKCQCARHNVAALMIVVVMLLCMSHCCDSLLALLPQQQAQAVKFIQEQRSNPTTIQTSSDTFASLPLPSSSRMIQDTTMLLSLSSNQPRMELPVQTQSQQMNDAMVLKTMRGTQWRVIEERSSNSYFGTWSPPRCKSLVTFSGFLSDTNKGTVTVEYLCGGRDGGSSIAPTNSKPTSGRWVTKPSRLAKGSVQLSPRWKVKLPVESGGRTIIYKGFVNAEKMIGRAGKSVTAEMVGVMLTGEEVNKEKVIGKFTADFVRQLTDDEVDAIKIGGGAISNYNVETKNGPITLLPK